MDNKYRINGRRPAGYVPLVLKGLCLLLMLIMCTAAGAAENTPGSFQVTKGKRYFISASTGKKVTGWITYKGGRYYLDPKTAVVVTGKLTIGGKLYYLNPNSAIPGKAWSGWRNIKGKEYYFNKKTFAAQRGWFTDQSKTYYFISDFSMRKGWQSYQKKQYFFDRNTGVNRTGFIKDDGKTYYCDPVKKYRVTGWKTVDGKKYYFSSKGVMQTGMQTIGGKQYIFGSDGKLITEKSSYTYKGIEYKISKSGVVSYKERVVKLAAARLDKVGWSLRSAFDWSSGMRYRHIDDNVPSGRKPAEYFASYGFDNSCGDCHVMACTFYYMAKLLGYDAHYMQGQVPLAAGGLGDHGWVEIDKDGVTYLCDPDYTWNNGRNGLMITYDSDEAWDYYYKRRMN